MHTPLPPSAGQTNVIKSQRCWPALWGHVYTSVMYQFLSAILLKLTLQREYISFKDISISTKTELLPSFSCFSNQIWNDICTFICKWSDRRIYVSRHHHHICLGCCCHDVGVGLCVRCWCCFARRYGQSLLCSRKNHAVAEQTTCFSVTVDGLLFSVLSASSSIDSAQPHFYDSGLDVVIYVRFVCVLQVTEKTLWNAARASGLKRICRHLIRIAFHLLFCCPDFLKLMLIWKQSGYAKKPLISHSLDSPGLSLFEHQLDVPEQVQSRWTTRKLQDSKGSTANALVPDSTEHPRHPSLDRSKPSQSILGGVCFKWYLHKCLDSRIPSRILLCNEKVKVAHFMISVYVISSWLQTPLTKISLESH